MIAVGWIWWPSMYVTLPLFVPFSAYAWSGSEWTIFSEQQLGWPINIGYSAMLAIVSVWPTRNLSIGRSVAIFLAAVVALAILVHGVMRFLGFHYWYDSP
jgi:hypothetical protein